MSKTRQLLVAAVIVASLAVVIQFTGLLSFNVSGNKWWMVESECSYNGDASFTCNGADVLSSDEVLNSRYVANAWSQELGETSSVVRSLRDAGFNLTVESDGTVTGLQNPSLVNGSCTVFWKGVDDDGSFTGTLSAELKGIVVGDKGLPCHVDEVESITYTGDYTKFRGTNHLQIENGGDFRIRYDLRKESTVSDGKNGGTSGSDSTDIGFWENLVRIIEKLLTRLGLEVTIG